MDTGKHITMLAAVFVALICTVSVPMVSDSSDAVSLEDIIEIPRIVARSDYSPSSSIVYLGGEIVLTENMEVDDGTTVYIKEGTTIDVGTFTFDLGKKSVVYHEGTVTLKMSAGGCIVQGEGTVIGGPYFTTVGVDRSMSYTYDGTVVLSETSGDTYGTTATFVSADGDPLDIVTEDSRLSLDDFTFTHCMSYDVYKNLVKKNSLGSLSSMFWGWERGEYILDTAKIEYKKVSTDSYGDMTVNDTVITAEYGEGEHAVHISVGLILISIKEFNIYSVRFSEFKQKTGVENVRYIENVSDPLIEIDGSGDMKTSLKIGYFETSRYIDGAETQSVSFTDNFVEARMDIVAIYYAVVGGEAPEGHTTVLKGLTFTSEKISMGIDTISTVMEGLTVELDNDGVDDDSLSIKVSVPSEDMEIDVLFDRIVFDEFRYGVDGVLNMKIRSEDATVTVEKPEKTVTAKFTDIALDISNMDLAILSKTMSRNGMLDIQDVLDSCDGITLEAVRAGLDHDGDGKEDMVADNAYVLLSENRRHMNTLTVYVDRAYTTTNGGLTFDIGVSAFYIESDGSLQTTISVLLFGGSFESNAHTTVTVSSKGFEIGYIGSDGDTASNFKAILAKNDETTVRQAYLQLDIDYMEVYDRIRMNASMNLLGYDFTVRGHTLFDSPEGEGDLDLTMKDLTGNRTFTFTVMESGLTDIAIESSLEMSATVGIQYYGIRLKLVADYLRTSSSDVHVDIDGYDYREMGLLGLYVGLTENDFSYNADGVLRMNSLTIYNDNWEQQYKQYSNTVVTIDDLSVVLKREVSLKIVFDHLRIESDMTGQDHIDRTIEHLTIDKRFDGSQEASGKDISVTITFWLMVGSIVLLLACIFRYFLWDRIRDSKTEE